MYYSLALPFLLTLPVNGLVAPQFGIARQSGALFSSSAQEFMDRAQEPNSDPGPQLFSDELLTDMQNCLLVLERRVKEGPGCLTHDELDDFAMAAGRVLQDMRQQGAALDQRVQPGERQRKAEAIAAAAAEEAERDGKNPAEIEVIAKKAFDDAYAAMIPPPPVSVTVPPVVKPPAAAKPAPTTTSSTYVDAVVEPKIDAMGHIVTSESKENSPVADDSDEDGPVYDGKGGLGLSRGTANTYVIPGMDEMTADEYQAALAQSVIERSRQKRFSNSVRGNKLTHDYMASLGSGTNVFGADANVNEEEEDQ